MNLGKMERVTMGGKGRGKIRGEDGEGNHGRQRKRSLGCLQMNLPRMAWKKPMGRLVDVNSGLNIVIATALKQCFVFAILTADNV